MQHKWHKEIKAWADGAEIEMRRLESWGWRDWETYKDFYWYEGDVHEYRIKPQPKEPQYLYVFRNPRGGEFMLSEYDSKGSVGKIKLED
jgi:hypothetical protein